MHLSGHCDLAKAFEQAKIDRLMEQKEKAQEKALRKALIVYEEWEGSSRHGKYVKHKKYCLVSGIWASFPSWGGVKEHSNNLTRKRIDGKHVLALQYFDRAPNGTGRYFKEIEKLVHKRKKHANGRRS